MNAIQDRLCLKEHRNCNQVHGNEGQVFWYGWSPRYISHSSRVRLRTAYAQAVLGDSHSGTAKTQTGPPQLVVINCLSSESQITWRTRSKNTRDNGQFLPVSGVPNVRAAIPWRHVPHIHTFWKNDQQTITGIAPFRIKSSSLLHFRPTEKSL